MSGLKAIVTAAAGAVALLAGGCAAPPQGGVTDVDPARWERPAQIVLKNGDTTSRRDMALFLRCDDRFDEDTLTLRITFRTPDSLRTEERFTASIPRTTTPAALRRIAVLPYRRRVWLARTGDYRVEIRPCRPVRGVEAVGITLQESE